MSRLTHKIHEGGSSGTLACMSRSGRDAHEGGEPGICACVSRLSLEDIETLNWEHLHP